MMVSNRMRTLLGTSMREKMHMHYLVRLRCRMFFEDDGGFSTVGMVLALLLTLSLMFSAAQVYRVQSAAADVQNVADAAALAAENQVAAFYIVVQVCDAAVLSLSLTGIAAMGLGVSALCTPATQPLAANLIDTGGKILEERNRFARQAAEGLNRIQETLPFLAAARAAAVVQANNAGGSGERGNEGRRTAYFGFAVLLPGKGEKISIAGLDDVQGVIGSVRENSSDIQEAAARAEEAAHEANEHKLRAFMADCGNSPGYCMHERAESLAKMEGASNPLYRSVDSWSFEVALKRARAYYVQRLSQEVPPSSSVSNQADSALRTRFYDYACKKMQEGYVHDDPTGPFSADFPLLPRNTDQMRSTDLYTERVYPISVDEQGNQLMHAWSGCPVARIQTMAGAGSVEQWEVQNLGQCPACEFSASSVGKIAAASSAIDNGFEYHYGIVAREARLYQEARERCAPASDAVKKPVENLMGRLKDLLAAVGGSRMHVAPPGRFGAVALVADTQGISAHDLVPTGFVSGSGSLGGRAALSAATLAQDDQDETNNVITSLLDGIADRTAGKGGFGGSIILDTWSAMLGAYSNGYDAMREGLKRAFGAMPLASESGLGVWAANLLQDSLESVGLEPAPLAAGKPVLVNTYHVASVDDGAVARNVVEAKVAYARLPGRGTGNPLSAVIDAAGSCAFDGIDAWEEDMVVASVELAGDEGPSIPVTFVLPPSSGESARGFLASAVQGLQGMASAVTGVRRWD